MVADIACLESTGVEHLSGTNPDRKDQDDGEITLRGVEQLIVRRHKR